MAGYDWIVPYFYIRHASSYIKQYVGQPKTIEEQIHILIRGICSYKGLWNKPYT